ncbi:hypothetical protein L3Y34_013753 [Caenorhabditis briggsae]|uniref:Uncharacterized protein n=1 Tax=Caenorhabditis briggsae TaxID=6238 RepID=A0AAE8ZVP4_CAEBR|nr:hypothetical protein L3Y34_013753 [Caenorhabditis briggsae]
MYDLFIKTVHDLISSYTPLFVSSPPKSSSSNLLRRLRRIRGAAAKILKSNQYHSPRLSRLLSKQKALFKLHQKSTSALERHDSRAAKTLVRRRLKANPSSHPITTCLEKIEMMKGLGVLKGLDIEEQLEHCGIVNAQIKTFGRVSRLMNNHAIFAEPSSNLAYSIRRDYEENQKNVWRIVVLFDDLRVKDQENPGNVVPAVNAELPIRASNSEFSNVPKTGILRNSSENSHEKTHTAFNSAAHNLDAGPSSQHGRDASRRRQKRSVTFL